jgi:putative membrane protein
MTVLLDMMLAGSNWDHGGFWWFPFTLLWVAVLGGVIWLAVRAMRTQRSDTQRATDILAERYARGEVSSEEYRERLEELRKSR